ncbi:hypothetical protein AB1K83_13155 [Sporosarcina sp. 179-K 3D1 HS]|uniref:hypothetical protein n=1 Tax=Sporosarcina sp. 179-K 3D1 HS TaxID=3232169 RepID=UPI0039A3CFE5
MFNKVHILLAMFSVFIMTFFIHQPAEASSTISGTFVSVDYEEVQIDKNTTEKRLSGITIKNDSGRTTTLNIDKYAKLYVDTVPVKIEAFKLGMEVEAEVNLRRVKTLHGKTGTAPAKIEHRDKTIVGTVTRLDPRGTSLSIRLDNGQAKTYYLRNQTEVFKGTALMDLSVLYEGDRVKLLFDEYDTNFIESIEVIVQGIKVESLYKGTISRIDPISKRIYLRDEMIFKNWGWFPNTYRSNSFYSYSPTIPIYVGNQLIKSDQLRHYANHDVYFATVSQFGKEVIEKMIIKKKNERTFYESMTAVNTSAKWISFDRIGKIPFHDGTILIRNGQLIDPISLQSSGKAFVVTEGGTKSEFANVVHITNDGFQSPNLVNHQIYFGKIHYATPYDVTLTEVLELTENDWTNASSIQFSYSNDTAAVEDFLDDVLIVNPHVDFHTSHVNGRYGYFYVADGHIVAAHLLDKKITSPRIDSLVSVGRFDGFTTSNKNIRIRNISQWTGSWETAPEISSMNLRQATLIRDGKVIPASQLKKGDRIYVLHESRVKGRILLVN